MKTYKIQYINRINRIYNEYEITTNEKIDILKMYQVEKSINKDLAEIRIVDEDNFVTSY